MSRKNMTGSDAGRAATKPKRLPISNWIFIPFWSIITVILLVIALVLTIGLNFASGAVDVAVGGGTYSAKNGANAEGADLNFYPKKYNNIDEAMDASGKVTQRIADEGMVLMKNDNTLPLNSSSKVTLLGRGAADPLYGGTGSGHTDTSTAINIKEGLEKAGFSVNQTVYDQLDAYAKAHPASEGGRINISFGLNGGSSYRIGEMPVSKYTDAEKASFADYNDAAIVVIGRTGGEGEDLVTDMEKWDDNYTPGQHSLELNKDEKDQIELAKQNFSKVIVIINSSQPIELGELQDDAAINAIVDSGTPGATGFLSLGEILAGTLNPSGHTVDTWARDFTKDPTFVNIGSHEYTNTGGDTGIPQSYFVNYEEGIYSGYRYYETAAVENFINYEEAVVYPFGYGLSYTTFDWTNPQYSVNSADGTITATVTVTNTGSVAGKDVVELFYSAPYTRGGIEKSAVDLGEFAKTKLLNPGESETVSATISIEDMASYDYKNAKAYVLESGDYTLSLRTDSHTVKSGVDTFTYNVPETITYSGDNHRSSDQKAVTNQFDELNAAFESGQKTLLSRADFAGTFPQAPDEADSTASAELLKQLSDFSTDVTDSTTAKLEEENTGEKISHPTTGANNNLQLSALRGLAYDDPQWQKYLDQLTVDEMVGMIDDGAYATDAVERLGKPRTVDLDGPAGFSSFINDVHGSAFPTETLIASTWNRELAAEMGDAIGEEALQLGVTGWYGPAVNMHRSPFAGRNFEYYSEDPTLSGLLAASVASAAMNRGVVVFMKHFALNDQEQNRQANGLDTWADEQTIREVYLKPFEIATKKSQATVKYQSEDGSIKESTIGLNGIMSSYNRIGGTWAGGDYALQTEILRSEWGFQGAVITDFATMASPYMVPMQGVAAGSDIQLTWRVFEQFEDTDNDTAVYFLRKAAHNVMFAMANSNALNGYAYGAGTTWHAPWWRWVQWIGTAVLAVLIVLLIVWMIMRGRKVSKIRRAARAERISMK
ncbi:glycoside hydrolase family 3 C-terminal domain-containing protein [Alloscardovia criceti]|uniref:glycoside hydrolase family 3 C-terminal domain-containing protein n=1 Tax=Alloscardovia criceti TaxID=356828 RepID=UPI000365E079|nr:glycoside hydrolase family 3 C-terminal domain-containing protein [Alloscardovia criceti]